MFSAIDQRIRSVVRQWVADSDLVDADTLKWSLLALRVDLERKIRMTAAAAENALYEKLATRIGVLLAENTSLRNGIAEKDSALAQSSTLIGELQGTLDTERAAKAQEIKDAVDAALELDSQKDAARIEEILRAAGAEIPAPVPPVVVPEPGEPAEVPADAPGEAPVPVDEGSLPETDTSTPTVDPVASDPGEVPAAGETTDPGPAGEAEPTTPVEAPADTAADTATEAPVETPAQSEGGSDSTQS